MTSANTSGVPAPINEPEIDAFLYSDEIDSVQDPQVDSLVYKIRSRVNAVLFQDRVFDVPGYSHALHNAAGGPVRFLDSADWETMRSTLQYLSSTSVLQESTRKKILQAIGEESSKFQTARQLIAAPTPIASAPSNPPATPASAPVSAAVPAVLPQPAPSPAPAAAAPAAPTVLPVPVATPAVPAAPTVVVAPVPVAAAVTAPVVAPAATPATPVTILPVIPRRPWYFFRNKQDSLKVLAAKAAAKAQQVRDMEKKMNDKKKLIEDIANNKKIIADSKKKLWEESWRRWFLRGFTVAPVNVAASVAVGAKDAVTGTVNYTVVKPVTTVKNAVVGAKNATVNTVKSAYDMLIYQPVSKVWSALDILNPGSDKFWMYNQTPKDK